MGFLSGASMQVARTRRGGAEAAWGAEQAAAADGNGRGGAEAAADGNGRGGAEAAADGNGRGGAEAAADGNGRGGAEAAWGAGQAAAAGSCGEDDACPGCLAAAGKSYTGRDGEEKYGRKGWRQAPSGAMKCVRPPQCRCSDKCVTGGCKRRPRKDCKYAAGTLCRCRAAARQSCLPPARRTCQGAPRCARRPRTRCRPKSSGRRSGKGRASPSPEATCTPCSPRSALQSRSPCTRKPATRRAVRQCQRRLKKRLAKLKKRGFAAAIVDEAFIVHDTRNGRKYWSLVGRRVHNLYTGSHKTAVVHGALGEDGQQLFRKYARADSYAFIDQLKELAAK